MFDVFPKRADPQAYARRQRAGGARAASVEAEMRPERFVGQVADIADMIDVVVAVVDGFAGPNDQLGVGVVADPAGAPGQGRPDRLDVQVRLRVVDRGDHILHVELGRVAGGDDLECGLRLVAEAVAELSDQGRGELDGLAFDVLVRRRGRGGPISLAEGAQAEGGSNLILNVARQAEVGLEREDDRCIRHLIFPFITNGVDPYMTRYTDYHNPSMNKLNECHLDWMVYG